MESLDSSNGLYRDFRSRFRLTRGTSVFSLFLRFVTGRFRDTVKYRAINYFKFILKKTSVMSHIKFLTSCVRSRHIPKGFRLKFNAADSLRGIPRGSLDRNLTKCSLDLMRATIRNHRSSLVSINQIILSHKSGLRHLVNEEVYLGIILTVRHLNNFHFDQLRARKERKLPTRVRSFGHQLPPPSGAVVTIPPDLHLEEAEKNVLSRGLSFCPTPGETDSFDLQRDIQAFFRRIQLRAFFHGRDASDAQQQPLPALPTNEITKLIDQAVPKKSNWNPPPSRIPPITHFTEATKELVRESRDSHISPNLPSDEIRALHSLASRQDIVIKPADKGGATVVWERSLYIQEYLRLLSNTDHYREIDSDPTEEYQAEVTRVISALISEGKLPPQARKLIVEEPRCSVFYILPKIHKPNNPGRPIVSTVNCPTSLISKFVDSICQPLLRETSSYLKDTNHTLSLLQDFRFSGRKRIIVTGDISNLYTVIDHGKGLRALRYFLNQRLVQDPPTDVVVRLAELVLSLNAFEFDSKYFQQVCGVAMGTKMGPVFACLYLAYLETQFFESYKGPKPQLFKRYIDDLLFIFSCTPRQATLFLSQFSRLDPDLTFTWSDTSAKEVPFLDILISAENDRVRTSVYSKPTDTHSYLLYSSFHPKSLLNSIPYSQFLRLRRLCSDENDFMAQCSKYAEFFKSRLYPSHLIESAIARAASKNRIDLLHSTRSRNTEERIPLVVTHTPLTSNLAPKIVDLYERILVSNPSTSDIFPHAPIKSFRKPTNLRQALVHSRLDHRSPPDMFPGTFPCLRNNCHTCPHTSQSPVISTSQYTYRIKHRHDCRSSCIIYAITCAQCRDCIYVGQTKRTLGDRFREHLNSVVQDTGTSSVALHFNSGNHSFRHMRVTVLTRAPQNSSARTTLENRFIFRFNSFIPPGLNSAFSFQ